MQDRPAKAEPLLNDDLRARFAAIVGERYALSDPADIEAHTTEARGLYTGTTPLVLKPADRDEVAAILKLATETGTPVIPQGGNTGLTGAQVPLIGDDRAVILSLSRLNRIRDIDARGSTMTVEAGVVLHAIHEAAKEKDRFFPLSLASEGSCQIGGNLSTNAGGTAVLAYGNTRQLCLGLEVVLPTGEIWDGLRRLKKDNTGYDLRDLFIGAEGTLGIITAAVIKLFPLPKGREVILAGLASPEAALALLNKAENICGPSLTGFELMPRIAVEFVTRHMGVRDPMEGSHPWYALIEISSGQTQEAAGAMAESLFETGYEAGLIEDAVMAQNETHRGQLWQIRESISEAQRPEGGSIKNDISVPVARVPEFIEKAGAAVTAALPGARPVPFGHMGDGNIHYNISQPEGGDKEAFLAQWKEITGIVHEIALQFGGSISAEHGIGQMKRDELAIIRPAIEIDLMHRIKKAFDPAGIMNPGKVLRT